MEHIKKLAESAKTASAALMRITSAKKNEILFSMADAIERSCEAILSQNARDLQAARKNGMNEVLLDRLLLNDKRIRSMAEGMRKLAALEDPVGKVIGGTTAANGLKIVKKRVPLGVVGMIYESRPNVTADAIGICIKTGNAVILKGGSEALHSNIEIARIAADAGEKAGLPKGAIAMISDTTREAAAYMMGLKGYIDVLVPRGGAGLIAAVVKNATVPVIETGSGNCHVFVDESADMDMASSIVINAKTSRPSVCNAIESLLVHKNIAPAFMPRILLEFAEHGVQVRGCPQTQAYGKSVIPATEEDYYTEYLDYIISVKIVDSVAEAVAHINKYGTMHSEAIVTASFANAAYFEETVDAAAVYVNASTRFTDGEEFGFGAEIGISTQKLHARGPMGLEEMTSYKYIIEGNGQIR